MKKLIAVLLLLVSAAANAGVYGFIEPRISMDHVAAATNPYEDVYGFLSYGSKFGGFVFGQSNLDSNDEAFRQVYAGPYWRATDWLELGVGYGQEWFASDEGRRHANRFGSYLDITGKSGYLAFVAEESHGTGIYTEARVAYQALANLDVGGIWLSDRGYGPRLQFKIPLAPTVTLNVWGAYLFGGLRQVQPDHSLVFSTQLEFNP